MIQSFLSVNKLYNKIIHWSTFSICPPKPLNQMSGPPLEIHLEDNAKPHAVHTPAHVPIH